MCRLVCTSSCVAVTVSAWVGVHSPQINHSLVCAVADPWPCPMHDRPRVVIACTYQIIACVQYTLRHCTVLSSCRTEECSVQLATSEDRVSREDREMVEQHAISNPELCTCTCTCPWAEWGLPLCRATHQTALRPSLLLVDIPLRRCWQSCGPWTACRTGPWPQLHRQQTQTLPRCW